ncbi:SlyX family protein [Luteimonas deserti]|uniref:Protein SlyX homolog n=1 Tax=Luteimonas deserti TaxID=2752306 RepID=A0A7Z0QUL4_9GAMM|nr:SlyX family protein [Luteimonas deserti]NYZ64142.1 SlyX family protein [Luteimonas deserti]
MTPDDAHTVLEARITELETRLAFQEDTLAQLNDALSEARRELGAQTGLLRRVMDDLRQARTVQFPDAADEPPPPHY